MPRSVGSSAAASSSRSRTRRRFFTALLPQFIDAGSPVVPQVIVLGATSLLVELAVLATYGTLAARAARLAVRPEFRAATNRLAGTFLIGAGLRMVALRRGQ